MAMPVQVIDKDDPLFRNMPRSFIAGRYHSWVVDRNNFPDELKITCTDDNNLVMAISHKEYDVRGVQFHPESVLTENGIEIIRNWLEI
jgi:anthranilate synthase component 2